MILWNAGTGFSLEGINMYILSVSSLVLCHSRINKMRKMRRKNVSYNISFHKHPAWVMMYGCNCACCFALSCVGRKLPCSGSIMRTQGVQLCMQLGHYIPSYYTSNTIRFTFETGGTQGCWRCEAYGVWGSSHGKVFETKIRLLHLNIKQKLLGRTNWLLFFVTTRTTQKTPLQIVLLMFCVYSSPLERVYEAVAQQRYGSYTNTQTAR